MVGFLQGVVLQRRLFLRSSTSGLKGDVFVICVCILSLHSVTLSRFPACHWVGSRQLAKEPDS